MAGRRELPEDVVMDILSMLPVKSLLRFRCVCKHWCALITSPSFIALHLSRASLRKSDYLVAKRINVVDNVTKTYLSLPCGMDSLDQFQFSANFDLPFFNEEYFTLLLSSSNGILCLNMDRIVLFNPATREFKALPDPSFSQTKNLEFNFDLDLVDFTAALGFGFDPKTSDYKVVRIVEFYQKDSYDPSSYIGGVGDSYPESSYATQVYNLSSNSWRELETIVPGAFCYNPCFDALFNGAWHWYVWHMTCSCGSRCISCESILSFHISDEVFQNIPLPDICSVSNKGFRRSLTVLNESLALILYKDPDLSLPADIHFDIWVMGEYGVKESWTFFHKMGPLSSICYPLAFWKDTELLMETSERQLVSCNLHDQNIKRFQVYGFEEDLEAAMYSESLVSIKSKDDVTDESLHKFLHVVN